MFLKNLYLHNFRNYLNTQITFTKNINVICGKNAQGKTNLLEAIYLLSHGCSFKASQLSELINYDSTYFYVAAEFIKDGTTQTISIYYNKQTKKIEYNNSTYQRFIDIFGIIPSVISTPTDIELIVGSPSVRRRFLNLLLAQSDPLYVYHLSRFNRALKQRNQLLKNNDLAQIEFWEQELAKSTAYITQKRNITLSKLNHYLTHILKEIENLIDIKYSPSISLSDSIKKIQENTLYLLNKHRNKEKKLKATLYGSHRDDFAFLLNNTPAKNFASEGQKRTLAIGLKLAEWQLLCSLTEEKVITCIDDFGMHLDTDRQKFLHEYLKNLSQVFITAPIRLLPSSLKNCGYFYVSNGKLSNSPT